MDLSAEGWGSESSSRESWVRRAERFSRISFSCSSVCCSSALGAGGIDVEAANWE